jgi:hypothetical protein
LPGFFSKASMGAQPVEAFSFAVLDSAIPGRRQATGVRAAA